MKPLISADIFQHWKITFVWQRKGKRRNIEIAIKVWQSFAAHFGVKAKKMKIFKIANKTFIIPVDIYWYCLKRILAIKSASKKLGQNVGNTAALLRPQNAADQA